MIYLYSVIIWLILVILAIVNGTIRNYGYGPYLNELLAHQISTIIFIALICFVTFLFLKFSKINISDKQAVSIGGLWLILTVLFEFSFQRYIMNKSWQILLADYNILQGRVWLFVLLVTFIAPYFVNKLVK